MQIEQVETWSPHPQAAPVAERDGDGFVLRANGTRTCCGGWQVRYRDVEPGRRYAIGLEVRHHGVAVPRDMLRAIVFWHRIAADQSMGELKACDYLLPQTIAPDRLRLARVITAPGGATELTLRMTFRWTATGESHWSAPAVEPLDTASARPPVRVAVVTGQMRDRGGINTVEANRDFYLSRCEPACDDGAQLIVLPEICLHWAVPGHALDLAVPVPGPEVEPFREFARRRRVRLCVGLYERDGDACHNSAILISPSGEVDGRYRKVHLATESEDNSGLLPGDSFPVFDTEVGRIGCNICMDSSAAESSRMVGLNGADFLLLPIMGDHRSDRWSPGPPIFCEHRWLAIQRTHAIDNQLCMVIARNTTQASCIIDRKGDILAWNEGDRDHIIADVALDDGYRTWTGSCFRDINWLQRRPSVYGPFVDPDNVGSLR